MTVLSCYRHSHQDIYRLAISVKSDYKPGISKQEIKGSSEKREQMKLVKTAHPVSVLRKQSSRQRDNWNYSYGGSQPLSGFEMQMKTAGIVEQTVLTFIYIYISWESPHINKLCGAQEQHYIRQRSLLILGLSLLLQVIFFSIGNTGIQSLLGKERKHLLLGGMLGRYLWCYMSTKVIRAFTYLKLLQRSHSPKGRIGQL